MVLRLLRRLWNFILLAFTPGPSDTDKFLAVMQEMLKSQQAQTDFLKSWAMGFQQTPPSVNTQSYADSVLENLEDSARLGNRWAQDLIANEDEFKEYVKLLRDQ